MKPGDIVRIVRISDPEFWDSEADCDGNDPREYEGRLGIVRGPSEMDMLDVQFTHGQRDSFWSDEMEIVKAKAVQS